MRAERGQATFEYAALLLLVAIVLGALAVAAPGTARSVLAALSRPLCVLPFLNCGPGDEPCVVRATANGEQLDMQIALVRLARGDEALLEERSDGSARITFFDRAEGGAAAGLGDADVDIAAKVASGRTWEFRSVEAAREFLDRHRARESLGAEAGRAALEALCRGCLIPWRRPERPDLRRIEGGGSVSGGGELGGQEAKGELAAALGVAVPRDGSSRTVHYRIRGAAAARLGASGEAVVALTIGSDGEARELALTTRHEVSEEAALPGGSRVKLRRGGQLETRTRLDLSDPDNLAAAERLARALPSGDEVELLAASRGLGDRVRRAGRLDVRLYERGEEEGGLGGELALGIKLGGGYTRTRSETRLLRAWHRPPGGSLVERDDCRAA